MKHYSPRFERQFKQLKKSKYLYIILFLPIVYYVVFHYAPMYGVLVAFKDYNIVKGILQSPWAGLKWFRKFVSEPYFWQVVRNTFLMSFYNILWGFPVPILLAILLNELRHGRFKKLVQSVTYLPHFISTVVVCGMLVNILSTDGLVNQIIQNLGHRSVQFLMYPQYFRTIYVASGIWQTAGWTSIIYLAALTGIDQEVLDAATIDGANRVQRIWHVTVPAITPVISTMLIMNLGKMMNLGYEKVLLLYNGSTYETADIISTYVYRRGILGNSFSYATAVGLFQSVIGVVLLLIANKVSKMLSETSLW
ncbi:ABC transporter permease subunit [uncultured Sphaerochaeta sp.]|uniref:ABC transporter permease n=1 Tax=uncultured Sphaerochaeta sp. TaxID=886478 RepID=UPI002A0A1E24|nr:ABC transporter permease subunit [uncultured Sphaerochaeta sp.]